MKTQTDLPNEARLEPDLTCAPFAAADFACRRIFLTGASGFIGAFLLAELLRATDARIDCLVRAANEADARRRLQGHLETYGFWQPAYAERILPQVGDLGQPEFALPSAQWDTLAAECDAILHNGAQVNFMRPYAALKAANVDATRQIIQLAMRHKTKPVHFISSIAVFFTPRHAHETHIPEDAPLPYDPLMQGGYKQSKWVAEHLFCQARERGLPVNIYRLARVFGDSETGIGENFDDLLARMLKACLELGAYPRIETQVNLVPADYVARAVVYLLKQADGLNQTLHLCNPRSLGWNELFAAIQSARGSLDALSYADWLEKLERLAALTHSAGSGQAPEDKFYSGLRLALKFPNYLLTPKPEFGTRQAEQCLRAAGITCPAVDERLMRRYLDYFCRRSFILPHAH